MRRKHHSILSADVGPPDAARVRATARANRATVSQMIREAVAEWLARHR